MVSAPDDLLAGRYRLVRLIAAGGMGVVYEARDELLERAVAVKLLRTQVGVTENEAQLAKNRAMREARIAARLHHPNAVPVFDAVEHEGQPCLVLQYVPSTPLSAILRDRGHLDPSEVAHIGAEIASALAAAHKLKIVHRDVKPGNILIADEDGRALISDFGISRAVGDSTLTSAGFVHGTPAYLAPEVARGGKSSYASDVFSLGSTLYAALEGEPPFGAGENSIAVLHRVARGVFEPPEDPGPLGRLILQLLAAAPEDRPTMKVAAARLASLPRSGEPATKPLPIEPSPASAPDAHRRDATKVLPVGAVPDTGAGRGGAGAAGLAAGAAVAGAAAAGVAAAGAATAPPTAEPEAASEPESTQVAAAEPEPDLVPEAELEPELVHEPEPDLVPELEPELTDVPEPEQAPVLEDDAEEDPLAALLADDRAPRPDVVAPVAAPAAAAAVAGPVGPIGASPPTAGVAPPAATPAETAPRERDRGRKRLVAVAAVLVLLVAVIGGIFALTRPGVGPAAEPQQSQTPSTSSPDESESPSPAASESPEPEPSEASPEPEPSEEPEPEPPAPSLDDPGQLAAAVTDYYALMPGNRDDAWPRMTADYQENHAGGRASYDAFWSEVQRVEVSDVVPIAPGRAEATISYVRASGTDVERTAYQFVVEDGILKIAATDVL